MTSIVCSDCGYSPLGRPDPHTAAAVHKAVPGLCPGRSRGGVGAIPLPPESTGTLPRSAGARDGSPVAPGNAPPRSCLPVARSLRATG